MNRRQFLTAALGAVSGFDGQAAQPTRPNVLILLADDLGWHDVGYHGSEIRTPNIDRLASQGTRLEHMYAFPICSPTRSGLMTGRSPMRLGFGYTVIRPWSRYGVPVRERFMPQAFHDAGYQTAITGKWHIGHAYRKFLPRARGFDHAYGFLNGNIDYFTHEREGGLDWNRDGKSVREPGYSTFLFGDEAIRWIGGRDKSRPFFLYVAFNAPHEPLEAPDSYLDKYANIHDENRRRYAAMTDAMDFTIGRILAKLDEEGIAGNTLVLFMSDNGGPLRSGATNTPLRAGKGTTFEGGIRVPAAVRWPGRVKAGNTSDQILTMMDLFPTLAGAAGIDPGVSLPLDGENLWPAITSGKRQSRGDLFFSVGMQGRLRFAVRHGEWKLVREEPRNDSPTNFLFRIDEDPNEKNDRSAQEPKLTAELVRRIAEWRKLEPPGGERDTPHPPPGWRAPKLWAEAAEG